MVVEVAYQFRIEGDRDSRLGMVEVPDTKGVLSLQLLIFRDLKELLLEYGVRIVHTSQIKLWKEGGEKALNLDRDLLGGDHAVFDGREKMKVCVTASESTTWDAAFVVSGIPLALRSAAAPVSAASCPVQVTLDIILKKYVEDYGNLFQTFVKQQPTPQVFTTTLADVDLKATVHKVGGRADFLMHQLPEKRTDLSEAAEGLLTKLQSESSRLCPIFGTSGCGKTRAAVELACLGPSLYLPMAKLMACSEDTQHFQDTIKKRVRMGARQHSDYNRSVVQEVFNALLLARVFTYNSLNKLGDLTPKMWLHFQWCVGHIMQEFRCADYFFDLFQKLLTCDADAVSLRLGTELHQVGTTVYLFIDEAQLLAGEFYPDFFESLKVMGVKRGALSPVLRTANRYKQFVTLPIGTGLSILDHAEELGSNIGGGLQMDSYVQFTGWKNLQHFKDFVTGILSFPDMDVVIDEWYNRFKGRFRPIVTVIQQVLELGMSPQASADSVWDLITKPLQHYVNEQVKDQSLFYQLQRIANRKRPNYLEGECILELIKAVCMNYFYCGNSGVLTSRQQLRIVDVGFGRCVQVSERGLGVVVDEPIALAAAYNFFTSSRGKLSIALRDHMLKYPKPSFLGSMWEILIHEEMVSIFHNKCVAETVLFYNKLALFPGFCKQKAMIYGWEAVERSGQQANAIGTQGYGLDAFIDDFNAGRNVPPFFILEDAAGPDILFFLQLADGTLIPVFAQLKLRKSLDDVGGAAASADPTNLYGRKDGNVSPSNLRTREKVVSLCKHGFISILIAYPVDVPIRHFVFEHEKPTRALYTEGSKLFAIISKRNVKEVFSAAHVNFLDLLKGTFDRCAEQLDAIEEQECDTGIIAERSVQEPSKRGRSQGKG